MKQLFIILAVLLVCLTSCKDTTPIEEALPLHNFNGCRIYDKASNSQNYYLIIVVEDSLSDMRYLYRRIPVLMIDWTNKMVGDIINENPDETLPFHSRTMPVDIPKEERLWSQD